MAGLLSIQTEPFINNREKNIERVENLIDRHKDKKLDLVLFPEFFSTGIPNSGFVYEIENDSYVLREISRIAKKYNTNICAGSVIEKENDKLYNTMYVIDRNGDIAAKYRKIHLFSYFGGNEHLTLEKGDKTVTVELDFAIVGLSICFDIRFPLLYNKLIKSGAEVIVCPNAWCVPIKLQNEIMSLKQEEMKAFIIARASENLVYFMSSSLSGSLGSGLKGAGFSSIVSPRAEIMAEAKELNEALYAEIDLSLVRKFKKEFPVYKID